MSQHHDDCRAAAAALAAVPADHRAAVMIGFDGFIDSICDVVDRRHDAEAYDRISQIDALGSRISGAAGQSTNIEVVVKQTKIGGNGPIMANAMLGYNCAINYVGVIGQDGVAHPVFQSLVEGAQAVAMMGPPAATDALEFLDGKIMMCKATPLNAVTVENLEATMGDQLVEWLASTDAVATVNWSGTVDMTRIWQHIADSVMPERPTRPLWFVDLADPNKRAPEDVAAAMRTLQHLQGKVDVVLGMNGSEGRQVIEALGGSWDGPKEDLDAAQRCAEFVRKELGLAWAMVHLVGSAACAWDGGSAQAEGFSCAKPLITTGAGDHFNAGFMSALLAGLDPKHCLLVGGATSGSYVRTAQSPSRNEVATFLENHADSQ